MAADSISFPSFIQSGVQGGMLTWLRWLWNPILTNIVAWGVVPVYLGEIAPPAFRALFGGLCYQVSCLIIFVALREKTYTNH